MNTDKDLFAYLVAHAPTIPEAVGREREYVDPPTTKQQAEHAVRFARQALSEMSDKENYTIHIDIRAESVDSFVPIKV